MKEPVVSLSGLNGLSLEEALERGQRGELVSGVVTFPDLEGARVYRLDREHRAQFYTIDPRGNFSFVLESPLPPITPPLPPVAPRAPVPPAPYSPGFMERLVWRVRWQNVDKALTWVGGWFLGAAALYVAYIAAEAVCWAVARAVGR